MAFSIYFENTSDQPIKYINSYLPKKGMGVVCGLRYQLYRDGKHISRTDTGGFGCFISKEFVRELKSGEGIMHTFRLRHWYADKDVQPSRYELIVTYRRDNYAVKEFGVTRFQFEQKIIVIIKDSQEEEEKK